MSRITLAPNASGTGTLTVAAPNTNTDRTLTLPDATGTVNISGLANEVPAGSAGSPSIYPTGDTNTGIFFPAADTIAFTEGGAEAMRIDSSGNVVATGGISSKTGSNSYLSIIPTAVVTNSPYLAVFNAANTRIGYANYWTGTDYVVAQTDGATSLAFGTNGTERMRIDASGQVMVGTTTASTNSRFSAQGIGSGVWSFGPSILSSTVFYVLNSSNIGVYLNSGGTAWNANSDERLKTSLTPFEDAVGKVCTLRSGTGRYLADDKGVSRSFLIAQDVQKVLPEAVDVQTDEMGTLGLRYTEIIPLLVAAIQEQQTQIATLEARLTALEAK